jgi:hypothetical protein
MSDFTCLLWTPDQPVFLRTGVKIVLEFIDVKKHNTWQSYVKKMEDRGCTLADMYDDDAMVDIIKDKCGKFAIAYEIENINDITDNTHFEVSSEHIWYRNLYYEHNVYTRIEFNTINARKLWDDSIYDGWRPNHELRCNDSN